MNRANFVMMKTPTVYFGKDLEAMSFAINYHQWIADEFAPYIGSCVAEVGAGTGNFSEYVLRENTVKLYAFEPSQNMYPILAERFAANSRVTVRNSLFGECQNEFTQSFDTVLYVNVLEHIENDSEELHIAFRAIKPGGHLLIFVPAMQWLYSDLDRKLGHFRRYHMRQLCELVSGVGFQIARARYFDVAGILPWYIAFRLMKNSMTGGKISAYDRWVVPLVRRLEGLVVPPVGKNIILVARKPA